MPGFTNKVKLLGYKVIISYDSNIMKYQLLVLIHPLIYVPFQGAVFHGANIHCSD